ncbi:hypothetical protein ABC383_17035 [Noviherbaspirillum sp. 1P10PC]|uniref:hypothetical protein n=1 Tax=Noviherbaspirillum sp. 1P10PC TaxID=3132292 RepID=UPI0039A107DB
MHKEETVRNLEASLAALREIIDEQRMPIQNLEHERDLFSKGYRAAMGKCEELEATASAQAAQSHVNQTE